ncbi:MAG: hypothetical protein LW822_10725 [Phycisphaeraceae bacterium]|jgi:hypothetical protein|nr:hypothetical protein [Phycisphaeraceae bacterium]
MPPNTNALGGRGFENQAPSVSRTYWRAPASAVPASITTLATIVLGTVVVQDVLERGAATIGGATRTAVAGAPRYTVAGSNVGADVQENVVIPDTASSTNQKALVLLDDSLEAGRSGKFASSGRVKALISGAVNRGTRLSIAFSTNAAARFKAAAIGDMVQAILLETTTGDGIAEVELYQVPYVTSVAGTA